MNGWNNRKNPAFTTMRNCVMLNLRKRRNIWQNINGLSVQIKYVVSDRQKGGKSHPRHKFKQEGRDLSFLEK